MNLHSDAHWNQTIAWDADENHTQIIEGDTAKLLGRYIPHPSRVSASLMVQCDVAKQKLTKFSPGKHLGAFPAALFMHASLVVQTRTTERNSRLPSTELTLSSILVWQAP